MSGETLRRLLRRAGGVRAAVRRELEEWMVLVAFSIPSFNRKSIAEALRDLVRRPLPSESMEEWWREFDRALHRRDWGRARRLASQLAAELEAVRGFSEVFAGSGPDVDAAMRELDEMVASLCRALGGEPVDPGVVEGVAARLRRRLP